MSVHKHAVLVGSRSNIILDHFFVNPKMSIRVEVVILKMATKSIILGVIVVLTYLLTREPGRLRLKQLSGESEVGIVPNHERKDCWPLQEKEFGVPTFTHDLKIQQYCIIAFKQTTATIYIVKPP